MFQSSWRTALCLCVCLACGAFALWADEPSAAPEKPATPDNPTATEPPASSDPPAEPANGKEPSALPVEPTQPPAEDESQKGRKFPLVRVSPEEAVWVDLKRKLVAVVGKVSMTQGPLELFACPRGSKEHESVVAVHARSQTVHAALVAVGANPGSPVRFIPQYQKAQGPRVDVLVVWKDKDGKQRQAPAQQWVRNVRTEKALEHSWVFGGSKIYVDEQSGERYYLGNDGDLICVSNFTTATLDLPIESSGSNEALLFEAFTENIPPVGTQVTLVLVPRLESKPEPKEAEPKEAETADQKP